MICRTHRFENGIILATVEMPYMETVSFGVWASAGGRHESLKLSGTAHFLEHMLFKGTAKRSARRLVAAVENLGGYLNAFTSEDHTCFYAKADARHAAKLCDVLMDMYCHARIPVREVEREREVIIEEIRMYEDQPSTRIEDLLDQAAWQGHPAGMPLTGTLKSVARITRDDLVSFKDRYYSTRNTVITVAGRVSHEAMVKLVEPWASRIPSGRKSRGKMLPVPTGASLVSEALDSGQCQLAIGFCTPGRRSPNRAALKLLAIILGGNMSSRLFQKLREKHGLCYSVQSDQDFMHEAGLLNIFIGTEAGSLPKTLDLLMLELEKLNDRAPSVRELKSAKEFAMGSARMERESTHGHMFYAGESIIGFGDYLDPRDSELEFMNVEPKHIQDAAREVIRIGHSACAILGNETARAAMERFFEKIR